MDKIVPTSNKFDGHISMRDMSIEDVFNFSEVRFEEIDGKKVEIKEEGKLTLKMMKEAGKFVDSVEIKKVEGGKVYNSFDDLMKDKSTLPVLLEIVKHVAGSGDLGEN